MFSVAKPIANANPFSHVQWLGAVMFAKESVLHFGIGGGGEGAGGGGKGFGDSGGGIGGGELSKVLQHEVDSGHVEPTGLDPASAQHLTSKVFSSSCPTLHAHWASPATHTVGGGGEGGGIGGGEGVVRTSSFWQHTFTLSPHMGPGTSGMQHLSMVAVSAANSCPVGQAHWLEPPGVINSFSLHVGGGGAGGGIGGGEGLVCGGGGEGGGIGGGEGEGRTSFWQHTSTLSPHMGPGTSGMQHLVMVAVDGANSCPVGQ